MILDHYISLLQEADDDFDSAGELDDSSTDEIGSDNSTDNEEADDSNGEDEENSDEESDDMMPEMDTSTDTDSTDDMSSDTDTSMEDDTSGEEDDTDIRMKHRKLMDEYIKLHDAIGKVLYKIENDYSKLKDQDTVDEIITQLKFTKNFLYDYIKLVYINKTYERNLYVFEHYKITVKSMIEIIQKLY